MAKPRTVPEEDAPVQAEQLPGTQLRAARESQGLTAQDVAARLHLDTRTIESLEADAYRELPNDAYVRGYIRTYARLVNVDASPLLESYGRHAEHGPALTPFASMPEPQARAGDFPVKAVTYLVVVTLVALLVLWSWQTHNLSSLVTFAIPKWGQDAGTPPPAAPATTAAVTPAKPSAAQTAPAAPAAAPTAATKPQPSQLDYTYPVIDNSAGPAPADTGSDTDTAAAAATTGEPQETPAPAESAAPSPAEEAPAATVAETSATNNESTAESPAGSAAAAPQAEATNATPAAATGGTGAVDNGEGLVLQVETGDSWIGIHDAAGKKLYFNLAKKGSRISVQGQLPYEVRIGRAAVVTILYQNKPLDVSAYTHQGVAHFQLTADGPAAP